MTCRDYIQRGLQIGYRLQDYEKNIYEMIFSGSENALSIEGKFTA
jgi:hypothetical protein